MFESLLFKQLYLAQFITHSVLFVISHLLFQVLCVLKKFIAWNISYLVILFKYYSNIDPE